jgi:hypothetical protein
VREVTSTFVGDAARDDLKQRIEATGHELRGAIAAVLEAVAGPSPRPTRVSRATGLDKSLASRLVRAVQNASDLELMHLVPSPGGLQIFAELSMRYADPASISNLLAAAERFGRLIDTLPGGRASIDAQISESSRVALAKREQIAKQASFKAMSFLLGHFCDVLTTTLFLVPSGDPRRVDGIEIQRRIGLRRMRPSTPLALLSFWGEPEDRMSENAITFDTLDGERGSSNPAGFLLPAFSTQPMGTFDIVQQGQMTTLVLAGNPALHTPSQLTSVFRIRNGWPFVPESRVHALRGYVLTTPCRQGVREVYIAESLYPDATPQLSFVLPGPPESKRPPEEDGSRHFSEVELTHAIEQRPLGRQGYDIPGLVNHSAVVRYVLERAGHGMTRFRGWRCAMKYPVPLVETVWWMSHPSVGSAQAGTDRGA